MVERLKKQNGESLIERIERQEKLLQKLLDLLIKKGIVKDEK